MAESKMEDLARQLLQSAREGKVRWSEGLAKSYDAHFPDLSLSIVEQSAEAYALTLINEEGARIETLQSYVSLPIGEMLVEIHHIARRQVLDIDKNIDKALEYLRRA